MTVFGTVPNQRPHRHNPKVGIVQLAAADYRMIGHLDQSGAYGFAADDADEDRVGCVPPAITQLLANGDTSARVVEGSCSAVGRWRTLAGPIPPGAPATPISSRSAACETTMGQGAER